MTLETMIYAILDAYDDDRDELLTEYVERTHALGNDCTDEQLFDLRCWRVETDNDIKKQAVEKILRAVKERRRTE